MDRKTVVILGAGISGLSAGIYALQNGFDTILLEKNPSVGGFCTGWYRKGRYLDGCIHWLTGSKEGSDLYKMWQNVHAFKNKDDLFYLDNFGSFEYDGQVVTLWKDTYRAEKEWIALSPTDKKQIKHFFKMVRDVASVDCPTETPAMHLPFKRILRAGYEVMKVWPSYLLTMKMTCHGYAKKFKSKAIQNAIIHAQPGPGNLFSMLFCYGTIVKGDGAIPYGGSKAMSERMKDYFLSLGGSLKLNSFAKEIVVKDKKAIGVLLKNGELIKGDYIVPAISSEAVFRKLLNDQYHLSSFERRLGDVKKNACPTGVLINLEVEDYPDILSPYTFEVEPFMVGVSLIDRVTLRSHAYDKDLYVKNGKTIVSVLIDQYDYDYIYWQGLYLDNKEKYYQHKKDLGKILLEKIIKRFPMLEGKIEILDIATPHTMHRYTKSLHGAYMSFLFSTRNTMYTSSGKIPGIKNLYLASQWMNSPGGLPFALASGRYAIQRICAKEKRYYLLSSKKYLLEN